MTDLTRFDNSLSAINAKLETMGNSQGDTKALVMVMDERSKHTSAAVTKLEASLAQLGKDYAEQSQTIMAINQKLDNHAGQLEGLKKFQEKHEQTDKVETFKAGRSEGIKSSVVVVYDLLKPALLPAAIALAGVLYWQKPSPVMTQTSAPTFNQPEK